VDLFRVGEPGAGLASPPWIKCLALDLRAGIPGPRKRRLVQRSCLSIELDRTRSLADHPRAFRPRRPIEADAFHQTIARSDG